MRDINEIEIDRIKEKNLSTERESISPVEILSYETAKTRIPLMKHAFLNEEETKKALSDFIASAPRLSMDKKCFEFEEAFAKYQGRKHACHRKDGQGVQNRIYSRRGETVIK